MLGSPVLKHNRKFTGVLFLTDVINPILSRILSRGHARLPRKVMMATKR